MAEPLADGRLRKRGARRESGGADRTPKSAHAVPGYRSHRRLQEILPSAVGSVLSGVWFPILGLIFGGCCSNVYTLEVLVKDAPSSGHLITFAQFLVVAAEGFLSHLEVPGVRLQAPRARDYLPRLRPTVIPVHRWMVLVVVFFVVSVLNNWALAYDVSMPIHIIFRSGGLIVSLILGKLVLGKRYSRGQVTSVIMISVGILMATFSFSDEKPEAKPKAQDTTGAFATGILLLSLAIFLSGWLGVIQEVTYRKYGKQWREGLFYTHAFSLPFFLIFRREILEQATVVASSKPVLLSEVLAPVLPAAAATWLDIRLPQLAVFLVLNVLTQYMCVSGVHRLTSVTTALTVNLVLNVRKFASLALSVWYFGNPFPFFMKAGAILVFGGLLLYSLSTARITANSVPLSRCPDLGDPPSPRIASRTKKH